MITAASLLEALAFEELGDGRLRARGGDAGYGVIMGGQLLAQSLAAAQTADPAKPVKTLHTVFARAGNPAEPLDFLVEPYFGGRSLAGATVTVTQGERVIVRSQAMLSVTEPDVIRHAAPMPSVPAAADKEGDAWQVEIVGGVDINDPALVGPAELDVWARVPGLSGGPEVGRAALAFSSDPFLIGTAMRPHEGVGQALAHKTLATGVLSHTLTFHDSFEPGGWMLLSQRSPFAGGGRSFGYGDVFSADGRLVASFVQDAMIRAKSGGGAL